MKKLFALLLVLLLAVMPALAETAPDPAEIAQEAAIDAEADAEEEYTGIGSASSLITVGILLLMMIAGLFVSAKRVKWDAAMITKAAACIAIAYILGLITLYRAPMGGSVTLVRMLPLILFTAAFGPLEGLLIGFVFGLLQLIIDPYVIHPIQLIVDYPMAYGAAALAFLADALPIPKRWKLPAAAFFGYLGRYIMAVLSGVVFFAEYAGDQGALAYSLLYNAGYLWPEAFGCMIIMALPGMSALTDALRKNSIR